MLRYGEGCPGLHIRSRAHFQGDAPVPDIGGEAAQPDLAAAADRDVVDDADAVTKPLGPAPLHGFPDRRQAEGLTSVNGDVEILPLHILERIEVPARRPARLGPGNVEAD